MKNLFTKLHTQIKQLHSKKGGVKKGFTILETLIAITVLVFAITGPLSLVAGSIRTSGYSRDSITAFYLAQEAIEYIRNTRDINALNDGLTAANWLDNIQTGSNVGGSFTCINNYGSEANKCSLRNNGGVYVIYQCGSADCVPLLFSGDVGSIPYGSDQPSLDDSSFTRNIWLERVPDGLGGSSADQQVIVNVLIKWRTGSVNNEFLLREYLTNWKSEQ